MEYLVYVNWIVFWQKSLALLSVSNDLAELKDSVKDQEGRTYQFISSITDSTTALNWSDLKSTSMYIITKRTHFTLKNEIAREQPHGSDI